MAKAHKIYVQDVTLRDGMHAISHQYTLDQVQNIAKRLDTSGVDAIEITHGDGLSGSSLTYGLGKHTDLQWIEATADVIENSILTVLLIPGIGTKNDLKQAYDAGARSVRVATHCSEADVAKQHIEYARELGMDTIGFLMMSHMLDAQSLSQQALLMESYGAECVYITDSAGALTMDGVVERVRAFQDDFKHHTQIGIHCHNNLGLGVSNAIVAMQQGIHRMDASLAGMGAGAGNTALETVIAVMDKMGIPHNCQLFPLMDLADDLVLPIMNRPVRVDRETLSLGYAGVYSSFLLHAEKASQTYGVDTREILVRLGELGMVGGQEDMIIDVALDLKKAKG